jgi:nickel/cobalt exporter
VASTTTLLFLSSCSTATIHALIPDHWLPFAVLARSQGWSGRRTMTLVGLTGLIHVLVSLAVGLALAAIGTGAARRLADHLGASLEMLGGGLLVVFGLVYGLMAHRREARAHAEHHRDRGAPGEHGHAAPAPIHAHGHLLSHWSRRSVTGEALVAVIGISPCVLMQPILFAAASEGVGAAAATATGFAVCTIGTMLAVTWAATHGMRRLEFRFVGRYGDLASGLVIAAIGLALMLGGV